MAQIVEIAGKPRKLGGFKPSPPDPRDLRMARPGLLRRLRMPRRMDNIRFCTRVEDQLAFNSCTANATTSAYEYLVKRSGKIALEHSRFFLYYATRVWVEDQSPYADEGAYMRSAVKALARFGTCYEATWPYRPEVIAREPSQAARDEAAGHQALRYYACPSLDTVKHAIYQGLPVVGGFMVPSSIDSPETRKNGVVQLPGRNNAWQGGHAVMFMGYLDDLAGGCLKFQNSWSEEWGNSGFGYLPYEYVKRGWALDFWAIERVEGQAGGGA